MLETKNLSVSARGGVLLLKDVSLKLGPGQAVGLTGQSGAGKTTLLRALLGLLNTGCRVAGGEIWIDGKELSQLSRKEQRRLRGTTLGFIPQNPMTAFDSRVKIGAQMAETLRLRAGLPKAEARQNSRTLLAELGIEEPDRVLDSLPGQLSGGQLQRVTVALLLALNPKYILADEPTSALDEENRRLLLDLLAKQPGEPGQYPAKHFCRREPGARYPGRAASCRRSNGPAPGGVCGSAGRKSLLCL